MTAVILYPLVVCLVGLLVFALSNNPNVKELGRIAFFCGLFWLVYLFIGHTLRF